VNWGKQLGWWLSYDFKQIKIKMRLVTAMTVLPQILALELEVMHFCNS
jgi:hypothetical protein